MSEASVLILDGVSETPDVLKAVFEPRGTSIRRIRGARSIESCASPDVVVIDLDEQEDPTYVREAWSSSRQVLISSEMNPAPSSSGSRFLEKPFEYPELVQMIEELLSLPPCV